MNNVYLKRTATGNIYYNRASDAHQNLRESETVQALDPAAELNMINDIRKDLAEELEKVQATNRTYLTLLEDLYADIADSLPESLLIRLMATMVRRKP